MVSYYGKAVGEGKRPKKGKIEKRKDDIWKKVHHLLFINVIVQAL